jgi:pimeloyl-ACP methyl ester carboxylesterase
MKRATVFSVIILLLIAVPYVATTQERTTTMSRAKLDGIELDYEVRGTGEPVVLAHAGVFADWFKPLMEAPALAGRYRLVRYHRIGYAGSSRLAGPVTIAQQAAHLRLLMRHLGIERAHIVGHSSSANIAMQLALESPDMVQSLALLEPALIAVSAGSQGAGPVLGSSLQLGPVFERYRAGDKAGAVDAFMRGVGGSAYRAAVDRVLPGAFDQAVVDADTFFGQELPAVRQWSFTREQASRITHPALAVIGAKSPEVSPVWQERQDILLAWLPKAEPFVLPDANHLLHVQNLRGMAEGLAAFFARHPLRGR